MVLKNASVGNISVPIETTLWIYFVALGWNPTKSCRTGHQIGMNGEGGRKPTRGKERDDFEFVLLYNNIVDSSRVKSKSMGNPFWFVVIPYPQTSPLQYT